MASSSTLISSDINRNTGLVYISYFASIIIITASIIIIIIDFIKFNPSNSDQLLQTVIVGYIAIMFGLILLFLPSSKLFLNNQILKGPKNVLGFIISSMPLVLTIGVLLYITILTFIFKDRIVKGRVANEYYIYSRVSSFLIALQLCYILYYIIKSFKYKTHQSSINIYILTTVNFIIIGIINIILKLFSTDG